MSQEGILDQLMRHEGFSEIPYTDTIGKITFGYGFTWISKAESEVVLSMRVYDIRRQLENYIWALSINRQNVLINMAYNLGFKGLMNFKRMWTAIDKGDYTQAALEILDSSAGRMLPKRYGELAEQMRKG